MRINGGTYRGRMFIAPESLQVRPTTDFAKSGLFNILANPVDFTLLRVLDLFAGIGGITFEFASRDVVSVTSVDSNPQCLRFITAVAEKLKTPIIRSVKADAYKFVKQCTDQFDLIFADPPFDQERCDELPELILSSNLLKAGGWLIIEHQAKRELPYSKHLLETRKYGNCAFSIYQFKVDTSSD